MEFDPEDLDLNLNMWVKSDGNDIKKTFERIEKLNLSSSAEIFEKLIMTYSYLPVKRILIKKNFFKIKIWMVN